MNIETKALSDEELSGIAGGYLEIREWVTYLSTQIIPVVYGLSNGASANDRVILENICGTLRSAALGRVDVVDTVNQLWTTYSDTYRAALQSTRIRATLDQTLKNAKQYIETHK